MSDALHRTAPTAEPVSGRTFPNGPTRGAAPGSAHESAVADSLVGSTDFPSLTLAGAVLLSEPDGAGSFPEHRCEFCRAALKRRNGEQASKFLARRFCNTICSNRGITTRQPVCEPKSCEHCHEPMVRRSREPTDHWNKRRFCSYTCSNRHAVGRRNHSGNTEGWTLGGGPFPVPVDKGREKELYALHGRYDAPGRTVIVQNSPHRLDARPPTHVETQTSLGAISR